MSFWHRNKEEKENSEKDIENGTKDVRDSAYETDDTNSEVDKQDKLSLSTKYSYAHAGESGVSQEETGKYAKDIQTLRGLQGMYGSEQRIRELSEEKQKTPWRDKKKRKELAQQTREEKVSLKASKELASSYLRKEGQKKVLAKYEKGMGTISSGAGKVAHGFQEQVIEGKGGVTVRGGTIYPKPKKKYVKQSKKRYYAKRAKRKKAKTKTKYKSAKRTKEKSGMPIFSGFLTGSGDKGKKPPMFFDLWG
jgi:hypothetical protein